ncbi:hypothetical protein CB1_000527010 [Camelus ferus]|nr:hypothetical protein CB1_000527010 [Camelus ferus]
MINRKPAINQPELCLPESVTQGELTGKLTEEEPKRTSPTEPLSQVCGTRSRGSAGTFYSQGKRDKAALRIPQGDVTWHHRGRSADGKEGSLTPLFPSDPGVLRVKGTGGLGKMPVAELASGAGVVPPGEVFR